MAALVCDICGGKLVMGAGGIAVCESCGMEHSADRMREKVQEIKGVVRVDNSHMIENYFKLAENALDASNNAEAENYCNKIIEIDPMNYKAWYMKGKAVGWQSTLGNQRIAETINAFTNALENCPEEEKEDLGIECKSEIENLHEALLSTRMQNFMSHPNDNDLVELSNDVKNILDNTLSFLTKAGINADLFGRRLGSVILNAVMSNFTTILRSYQGDDGRPGDYEFRQFIAETDRCIKALGLSTALLGTDDTDDLGVYDCQELAYKTMVLLNTAVRDACSWDYSFTNYGKHYYKHLTLNATAVAERNKQNAEWEAKATEWRSKKSQKETEIKAERDRKAKEEAQKAAEEAQKAREEAQRRFDAYWADHAEEKAALETEKEELDAQISTLYESLHEQATAIRKEMADIPGKAEINNIEERITQLRIKKEHLGLFSGKEKKALQEQIDQAYTEKKHIEDRMAAAQKEIEARIEAVTDDFQEKISPLQNRVDAINNELTKDR